MVKIVQLKTWTIVDDKTMQYYNGNGIYFQIGGFTWSGHFTWIDIPEAEKARTNYEPTAPVRTPTMAGKIEKAKYVLFS